ncbi:hypothetical protein MMC20_003659 [Loxospora ochrophaea]|nr:hypothetical protein [Loxospora ochrophaea]
MADAISIEEANKIRVAIGLKPLPVPGASLTFKESDDSGSDSEEEEDQGSTLESRQAQGYDNWKKLQDEADAKAKREAKNEAIRKARDAARKRAKLEGKGLGEADDTTELDTRTWLIQQKKRQRKLEKEKLKKTQRELAEREQAVEHTAEDLAGVKVGHGLRDFEAGDEQVLTLKDTTIDENEEEGDELENLDLRERERLNEKLELKKRKPVYNPNDVDESGDKVLLQHYDEVIDGKKRKRFTLNGEGTTVEQREDMKHSVSEKLKAQPISLDILKDLPASDYVDASEIKIKKPKKKKAKTNRQTLIDDDDVFATTEPSNSTQTNMDTMDVDLGMPAPPPKPRDEDISFVDDDDLQASLAKQRREALKKRKRTRPEDIAKQLREESNGLDEEQPEDGGLVIDETSEFVANLQRPTAQDTSRKPSKPSQAVKSPVSDNEDMDVDRSYNDVEDEDIKEHVKRETSTPAKDLTVTGLEEESTLDKGVGAVLSMLTQRGLVKTSDSGDLNALHRERQKFLADKQKREAEEERKRRVQRERDRASGKLERMSAREREQYAMWENKTHDQQASRQMADIFNREYKPDVQLKYVDEFGRSMNKKEAFKHLSHQFHGKGSGKQKTEKHLKKIEDDKKREAQSTLDSSQATGMNNAMGATARKNRQAGVRLA